MDLIQTWYDDRCYCTLHFDTSLVDLNLDSVSQKCEKAKTSASVISQSFQLIRMEFIIHLRFVGVVKLILLFYLVHSVFKGKKPTYMISLKSFNVGFYLDITSCCKDCMSEA